MQDTGYLRIKLLPQKVDYTKCRLDRICQNQV